VKKIFLAVLILSIYSFSSHAMDISQIDPTTITYQRTKGYAKWKLQLSDVYQNIAHEIILTCDQKNDTVTGLFRVRDKRTNKITYVTPLGDKSFDYLRAAKAMSGTKRLSRTS